MAPEEARYAALRELGGVEQIKEECRDMRRVNFIQDLLQDVHYGLRQLRRSPGFTVVVVLTLALGIGGNTAVFSLVDAVMLKMLPVKNPEQLVLLNWVSQKRPSMMKLEIGHSYLDTTGRVNGSSFSHSVFQEFHARNRVFSGLFGFAPLKAVDVNIDGQASLANGELVTGDYFSTLGVSPALGRTITNADEKPGAPRVAVISYGYWSRQFGHSPSALDKSITINTVPVTIVGVAPRDFFGVQPGHAVDLWVPLVEEPRWPPWGIASTSGHRSLFISRDSWWLMVMGRLKPGISGEQANVQLDFLFRQITTASLETPPKPQFTPPYPSWACQQRTRSLA